MGHVSDYTEQMKTPCTVTSKPINGQVRDSWPYIQPNIEELFKMCSNRYFTKYTNMV